MKSKPSSEFHHERQPLKVVLSAAYLVVTAEAIGILPVALPSGGIVVVVRIAIEDQVPARPFGIVDEQPRAVVVMKVHQFKYVVVVLSTCMPQLELVFIGTLQISRPLKCSQLPVTTNPWV
jgi:hypothetical protein